MATKKKPARKTVRRIPPPAVPGISIQSLDIDAVPERPVRRLPIRDMSTLHDLPIDHDEETPRGGMFSSYEAKVELPKAAPRVAKAVRGKTRPVVKAGSGQKRPVVRLSLYRKLATTFIGLAVLLLGFVIYVAFARATVTVLRKPIPATARFTVTVRPEPKDEPGVVAGAVLETVAEGMKTIVASGDKKTVDGKACGTVTVINGQGSSQPLVVNTRLLSEAGILFRLQEGITVPAGGRVDTRACADLPGAGGDIAAARFTIPGLNAALQEKTYAVSTAAMKGGVVETSVVTQKEVDAAIESYAKEVADDAAEKLVGMLARPDMGTGKFVTHKIVRRETTAQVGKEQDRYDVTVAVSVSAVFYDQQAVERTARQKLMESLGEGMELQALDRDSYGVDLKEKDVVGKSATLDVSVNGSGVMDENNPAFDRKKLAGMSLADAQAYITGIEGVQSTDIILSPAWTKHLPNLADHITLIVK